MNDFSVCPHCGADMVGSSDDVLRCECCGALVVPQLFSIEEYVEDVEETLTVDLGDLPDPGEVSAE